HSRSTLRNAFHGIQRIGHFTNDTPSLCRFAKGSTSPSKSRYVSSFCRSTSSPTKRSNHSAQIGCKADGIFVGGLFNTLYRPIPIFEVFSHGVSHGFLTFTSRRV